ncbi:hypothetical protein D1872_50710 [compost metagenome]
MLHLITLDPGFDLNKGKGNRDGLIQQVVTYVRDGRTVTRKQWVRSEFADHAKKNEEEKKKTLLEQQEREDRKHQKIIAENNQKKRNEDKREHKKLKTREAENASHGRVHKVTDKQLEEYKRKLKEKNKKSKKEEKERKEQQTKDNKKETKKESKHSRYGQSDQTRADNKAEQSMLHTK